VWFVGQTGHYVGVLDPATSAFRKFDLDDGTGPHNLVVGEDGIVWYAGNAARHIGRLDPATGEIRKFMMPDERARDPHTLVWSGDRTLWFTVQQGNFVGHLDPASGDVRLVEMPQAPGRGGNMGSSRPYGIEMDSRDRPWIVLFNTNKVAMVDPGTLEPTIYDLPEGSRPRRLVIDSRDRVWYVDYAQGQLGRLDPDTREVTEWPLPGGEGARPYAMAIDEHDRIWLVETGLQPNRFVGFDAPTESFISTIDVEGEGNNTVRHMVYHQPSNSIWYGSDVNMVGRAVLPPLRRPIS
jgi:virginiamycin B lyase